MLYAKNHHHNLFPEPATIPVTFLKRSQKNKSLFLMFVSLAFNQLGLDTVQALELWVRRIKILSGNLRGCYLLATCMIRIAAKPQVSKTTSGKIHELTFAIDGVTEYPLFKAANRTLSLPIQKTMLSRLPSLITTSMMHSACSGSMNPLQPVSLRQLSIHGRRQAGWS